MTFMTFELVSAVAWPPLAGLLCRWLFHLLGLPPRARLDPVAFPWLCVAAAGALMNACLAQVFPGDARSAAVFAVQAVIALAIWRWRRRKGRKRSPRAFGAKSRARIAGLVATVRERARPRPVLRPLPGGAQAIRSLKSQ